MFSSVWLEVGLAHFRKIGEIVESNKHCRLELVNVMHDFTNRLAAVFYHDSYNLLNVCQVVYHVCQDP